MFIKSNLSISFFPYLNYLTTKKSVARSATFSNNHIYHNNQIYRYLLFAKRLPQPF